MNEVAALSRQHVSNPIVVNMALKKNAEDSKHSKNFMRYRIEITIV